MGVPPRGTPKYKKWLNQQKRRKREVRLEAAKAKARKLLNNEIEQLRSEVEAVTRRSNKHFRRSGYFEAAVAAAGLEKRSLLRKLAAARGVHDTALELMRKARKEQERAKDRLQWREPRRCGGATKIEGNPTAMASFMMKEPNDDTRRAYFANLGLTLRLI